MSAMVRACLERCIAVRRLGMAMAATMPMMEMRTRPPTTATVTITAALLPPAAEFEEEGESRTHLASGGEGIERNGQRAGPAHFERHRVSFGDGVDDLVPLRAHHLASLVGRLAHPREVASCAPLGLRRLGSS